MIKQKEIKIHRTKDRLFSDHCLNRYSAQLQNNKISRGKKKKKHFLIELQKIFTASINKNGESSRTIHSFSMQSTRNAKDQPEMLKNQPP